MSYTVTRNVNKAPLVRSSRGGARIGRPQVRWYVQREGGLPVGPFDTRKAAAGYAERMNAALAAPAPTTNPTA